MIWSKTIRQPAAMLLTAMLCGIAVFAQTEGVPKPVFAPLQTFYLTNISQPNEANEILTTIRDMLTPASKVYLASNENAIFVLATPDQLPLVRKIISDLDHARKTYRLTYTINESDGGKRIGSQHFALIVVSGQRTNP